MSDGRQPKISQVAIARGIVYFNQRLGERTPARIMKLASTRLPFDPVDPEVWTPLATTY